MMRALLFAVGLLATSLLGSGAVFAEDEQKEEVTPRALYEKGVLEYRKKNCIGAEPIFRQVQRDYPYSRFAPLAELRIADCKFDEDDFPPAVQAYRQFIRARPSHREVPYAQFRIGKAQFKQIPHKWFLAPPTHERDQGAARDALRQLRHFTLQHPGDHRVAEAESMIRDCLKLLAQHELYVAQFYMRRKAYRGVASRLQAVLTEYQGSGLEPEVLLMLGDVYKRMKDHNASREIYERLINDFPKSKQAKSARKILKNAASKSG